MLEVTGKKGLVELNGSAIGKGGRRLLEGGDEVAFCKHAFIFQRLETASDTPPSGSQVFKDRLEQGILGPDAIQFTLEDFPYYLSPNTKRVLLSAALLHMEKKFIHMEKKLIKSLSGISSLNQQILLSGPSGSEIYQETLIKALAKNFGARLLIVDSLLLPVNELHPGSSGYQVEVLGVDELIEVIKEESRSSSLIVLLKDVEKILTGRPQSHASLGKELPPGVLIIGSHTEKDIPKVEVYPSRLSLPDINIPSQGLPDLISGSSESNSMKHLNNLFPYKISIEFPKDEAQLSELKKQLKVHPAGSLGAKASTLIIPKTAEDKPEETTRDEDRPGRSTRRYMPAISVQGCVVTLGNAGERLQACSAFLEGYHVPITQIRDFMQSVAAYSPNSGMGQTQAALTGIAQACGSFGTLLGHVANTVQGLAGIGRMAGSGFRGIARLYGPEVVPEPEPKPAAAYQPAKITTTSIDQVDDVIRCTSVATVGTVEVDVGPDVTPSMAVNIYNEFRTRGSNSLALISGGENMMAKRAMYFTQRTVD